MKRGEFELTDNQIESIKEVVEEMNNLREDAGVNYICLAQVIQPELFDENWQVKCGVITGEEARKLTRLNNHYIDREKEKSNTKAPDRK